MHPTIARYPSIHFCIFLPFKSTNLPLPPPKKGIVTFSRVLPAEAEKSLNGVLEVMPINSLSYKDFLKTSAEFNHDRNNLLDSRVSGDDQQ